MPGSGAPGRSSALPPFCDRDTFGWDRRWFGYTEVASVIPKVVRLYRSHVGWNRSLVGYTEGGSVIPKVVRLNRRWFGPNRICRGRETGGALGPGRREAERVPGAPAEPGSIPDDWAGRSGYSHTAGSQDVPDRPAERSYLRDVSNCIYWAVCLRELT